MFSLFMQGGPLMWFLLLFSIIIVALTIKNSVELFIQKNADGVQLDYGINAILFWGVMSAALGFFGHYQGLYLSMKAILAASDISPMIVAEGYGISLLTILFGLMIFMISGLIWLILKWKLNSLNR